MSCSSTYSAEVVQKVNAILAQGTDVGPITKWGSVLAVLTDAKIAYQVPEVSPDLLLVHPENRSKLGVNAFNAHRVGAYIRRVGADLGLLAKATAFELSAVEPKRSEQIAFNRGLVERSSGMLAELSGGERYLSVGCGHTAQFAKAVGAQCRTPQASLQDANGRLNLQHIAQEDPALMEMCTKGWAWTILPWQVEATWPALPDLAQRALNASNSVASQASELETASAIAEFAQMTSAGGREVDWQQCISAAAASMPPCADYICTLGKYVRMYGGGDGAPMVRYLDEFAKIYGENRRLGQEYLTAVTETVLAPAKMHPFLRVGLVATNLVSPKVVDGIAKLLVKSDVERLRSKDLAPAVDEAESAMASAWAALQALIDARKIERPGAYQLFGRLQTRVVLKLLGKAKAGPEKRVFANLGEIKAAFADDLKKSVPGGCDMLSWETPASETPSAQPAAEPALQALPSMSTLSDPAWVANQKGFQVGQMIFEKAVGPSKGIYKIVSIGGEGVSISEHDIGFAVPRQAKITIEALLKQWSIMKGELPTKLESSACAPLRIAVSEHVRVERQRAALFEQLAELATERDKRMALIFCMHPSEVRVGSAVAKGKLELMPATDLKAIGTKAAPGAVVAKLAGDTFYLSEPSRPRSAKASDWRKDAMLVPFWWLATSAEEDDANMVEKVYTDRETKLSVKCYTNSRQLKAHERLVVFKARKEAVPLSAASDVKRARVG